MTNVRGLLFSLSNCPVPFCPDTGTTISLISRGILHKYFPGLPTYRALATIHLSGIGQGLSTNEFVELPFYLVTIVRESLPFITEIYIIDHLLPSILFGTHFLSKYSLDIVWAKNKDQVDVLVYSLYYICITIIKDEYKNLPLYYTNIYVDTSTIIQPGIDLNLPV